ncbi:hypothetical protein SAMN04487988_101324 [Algoriphagus hitonicola]|uniref:Uncharacterized protein n=2 Tax=Algoriphagus hitonicola TaxID=435880 RepID=A0A1I2P272_9BACT|nr:hypothetical protein [Algoriphagus hitonicola]SFG07726.1 hypothetical protein SAMN04487988_101324 [Algoriphagus hitonicola]
MDKIFRQKLENHEEKPSALAWERLENQLPSQPRKNRGFLWAAAAVILVLLSVGALFWSNDSTIKKEDLLASEEQNPALESPSTSFEQVETPKVEENPDVIDSELKSDSKQSEKTVKPAEENQSSANFKTPATNNLLAEADKKEETVSDEKSAIIRNKSEPLFVEKNLPELKTVPSNPTIAELNPVSPEKPAYTVTIRSDGLKDNKGLVANLGKTVDQLEGLTEKVDLFANLQDAKNGLYARLTSKKERASQKP